MSLRLPARNGEPRAIPSGDMRSWTRWGVVAAAMSLLLAACAPVIPSPSTSPTDVAGYRAIWEANHPANYTYTIERTCFCLPLGPLSVTVQDGVVTSILTEKGRHLHEDRGPLTAYPVSIDALFDYAEEAEARSARSAIGYDPTLGYPAALDIDWDSTTPDDDVQIQVTDFHAV